MEQNPKKVTPTVTPIFLNIMTPNSQIFNPSGRNAWLFQKDTYLLPSIFERQ